MWNITGARGSLGVGPELLKLGPFPATSQLPVPGTCEGTESLLHMAVAMELCMCARVHLCVCMCPQEPFTLIFRQDLSLGLGGS